MAQPTRLPTVSVIIPACNAAGSIADTLASVRSQSYSELEIVVVDDGSTDATAEIVANAARDDARIALLRQERSGVAAARNRGIAASRGAFIAPLDSDDWWHPDKTAKQLARFNSGSVRMGLVYSWTRMVDESGVALRDLSASAEGDVLIPLLLHNLVGHGSGPLIRRECLEVVGGFNPEFYHRQAQGCEDWDLYRRIAQRFEFGLVPEYLVCYRVLRGGMSKQHRSMERSYRFMWERIRADLPRLPRSLVRWCMSNIYDSLAIQAREGGAFVEGLKYWLLSAVLNPVRFLEARTYRMGAALMLRRSANPKPRRAHEPEVAMARPLTYYARRELAVLAHAQRWWSLEQSRSTCSTHRSNR